MKAETAALRFQSPENQHCPLSPSFSTELNFPMLERNQNAAPLSRTICANLMVRNLFVAQQEKLMLTICRRKAIFSSPLRVARRLLVSAVAFTSSYTQRSVRGPVTSEA